MSYLRLGYWLLVLGLSATSLSAAEDLHSREDLSPVLLVTDGKPRTYTRLDRDDRATYLFCGRGELRVLSRGILGEGQKRARYTLAITVDGARPVREQRYRVDAAPDATFDRRFGAAKLRRTKIDLERGCHTVELALKRSTIDAVGIRLTWDIKPPKPRRWTDATIRSGGHSAVVAVDETRAPYQRLAAGEAMLFDVEGPAWVRMLARAADSPRAGAPSLTVDRNGKRYRAYRLSATRSRKARLEGGHGMTLSKAEEVVFAVGRGRHRLRLQAGSDSGLLLRPQVADRNDSALPDVPRARWSSGARLATYYDDNILRYSDKFIQRFENGQDPDRFRVESLDDTIQRVDLSLDRSFAGLGARRARVGVDVEHRAYLRNDIKDWSRLALSWRQELARQQSLEVSFSWAPDFYVRHLRDSDLTGRGSTVDPFQAFEFERSEGRVRFNQELSPGLDARYHLGLAVFRHSSAFREFDSENLFGGLRLDHQLTRSVRLSYGVELTDSSARGYDEAGETLATSDDTDPSYEQFDLMLAARFSLPGPRNQILFLQAEVGQRDYTTDKPAALAPLHNGRDDELTRLYASWRIDLTQRYRLTVFAQARERSSSAQIDLDIGVEKDFEQFEAGVRVSGRF